MGWFNSFRKPVLDVDNTLEVSMVSLPKSPTSMVHKAEQAPLATGKDSPSPRPKPIRESDLTMSTFAPDPEPGNTTRSSRMDDLLRKAKMQELLESDAALGTTNRAASDPDANSDVAINTHSSGLRSDPELARYVDSIQRIFRDRFEEIPAIDKPEMRCKVHFRADLKTGKIISRPKLKVKSGNLSFDSRCMRAVEGVGQVPTPPEKFHGHFTDGYVIVIDNSAI